MEVRQTKYLLYIFHQRTPLDWATRTGHEAVVAYLKRAADPNMLEVSMSDCTIEDSCGVKWIAPTLTDTS